MEPYTRAPYTLYGVVCLHKGKNTFHRSKLLFEVVCGMLCILQNTRTIITQSVLYLLFINIVSNRTYESVYSTYFVSAVLNRQH
jgi:hypothetical protein